MDPLRWKTHRVRNTVRSVLLMLTMAGLLGALGWFIAGELGVVLAAAGALVLGGFAPGVSSRVALRMAGAHPLPLHSAPELHHTMAILSQRADLSDPPALHYVPSSAVNAFAVGEGRGAAIALTDGLLRVLSRRELTGVLAHELSHVRNGDAWLLNMSGVFTRLSQSLSTAGQILLLLNIPLVLLGTVSFSWIAIAVLIFAPAVSALLHLALARTREFDADLGAVALTHDPAGLASALRKLSRIERGWFRRLLGVGQPPSSELLRTHPATAERIRRLEDLQRATAPMATPGWTSRGDHATRSVIDPVPDIDLYRHRRREPLKSVVRSSAYPGRIGRE